MADPLLQDPHVSGQDLHRAILHKAFCTFLAPSSTVSMLILASPSHSVRLGNLILPMLQVVYRGQREEGTWHKVTQEACGRARTKPSSPGSKSRALSTKPPFCPVFWPLLDARLLEAKGFKSSHTWDAYCSVTLPGALEWVKSSQWLEHDTHPCTGAMAPQLICLRWGQGSLAQTLSWSPSECHASEAEPAG